MSDIIGWDLMYKVSEKDLKKKEDVLTLLIHFLLIRAGYRCVGIGEDHKITGNESACETLPTGWSSFSNPTLRYMFDNTLYILRSVPVNDNVVYNLLRVENLNVSNVAFNINETIETLHGTLDTIFKNKSNQIVKKIRAELLHIEPGKEATTQTSFISNRNKVERRDSATGSSAPHLPSPQRQPSPQPPQPPPLPQLPLPDDRPVPFWIDPEIDPLRVGRADLNPFGQGGGMIYNPFGTHGNMPLDPGAGIPGGIPRGSVPPGARFDPFGPPNTGPTPPPPRNPPPPDPDVDYGHHT